MRRYFRNETMVMEPTYPPSSLGKVVVFSVTFKYSLRSILLFTNIDISTIKYVQIYLY
jgi:hypothetical protein